MITKAQGIFWNEKKNWIDQPKQLTAVCLHFAGYFNNDTALCIFQKKIEKKIKIGLCWVDIIKKQMGVWNLPSVLAAVATSSIPKTPHFTHFWHFLQLFDCLNGGL